MFQVSSPPDAPTATLVVRFDDTPNLSLCVAGADIERREEATRCIQQLLWLVPLATNLWKSKTDLCQFSALVTLFATAVLVESDCAHVR